MSIHMLNGKPGGGKGLVMMAEIDRQIRETDLCILTNFAVEIEPWVNGKHQTQLGYEAYLFKNYNRRTFDAGDRIFRIKDEWAGHFFRFRALPVDITSVPNARPVSREDGVLYNEREFDRHVRYRLWASDCDFKLQGDRTTGFRSLSKNDYDLSVAAVKWDLFSASGGMYIHLDEIWKFWGARNWATTDAGVVEYSKQHRKVSDDCFWATQHNKDVDTALNRVCQDFYVCRNRSKLRIGAFKNKANIEVSIYESPPTGSKEQKPQRKYGLSVDVAGLAQCYDTTSGHGLKGRTAGDIGAKHKGLPYWTLWCIPFVLAGVVWMGMDFLLHGSFGKHVVAATVKPQSSTNGIVQGFVDIGKSESEKMFADMQSQPQPQRLHGVTEEIDYVGQSYGDTNRVWCTGYYLSGNDSEVYLSDGTTAYASDNEIQEVRHNWVKVFGKRFRVVKAVVLSVDRGSFGTPLLSPEEQGQWSYPQRGGVEVLPSIHGIADGLPAMAGLSGVQQQMSSLQNVGQPQTRY